MENILTDKKAPAFNLYDNKKIKTSLNSFTGDWVVLYFYPKDNTSGCTIEAIDFTNKLKDFEKLNCKILGVSPDSIDSHCDFIFQKDLELTLLSDEKREVLEKYGVWQEKSMYGRKFMGVVRTTFLIDPTGNIRFIWEKVKVADHAQKVFDKLQELLN